MSEKEAKLIKLILAIKEVELILKKFIMKKYLMMKVYLNLIIKFMDLNNII